MDTVATITGELYKRHGSLIFDHSQVIWNEARLSIIFFQLYIIFNHFILPWVVLTTFQIHQNLCSRDLQHDTVLV